MSTTVTIKLWDPRGRAEETWDKVAKLLDAKFGTAVIDVQVEEVNDGRGTVDAALGRRPRRRR